MENEHAAAHTGTCQNLYNRTPQSLDYVTCAESIQLHKKSHYNSNHAIIEIVFNSMIIDMKI